MGGGANYHSEEERGEDKCKGNHKVKENNTNINIAALLPQEETEYR